MIEIAPQESKCPRCGQHFLPSRPNQKYCFERCRKKDERARWDRRRSAAHKEFTSAHVIERACIWCGQEFSYAANQRGPLPMYCGEPCRRRADNARENDRTHQPGQRHCQQCGKRLNLRQEMRHAKYCGTPCKAAARVIFKGTLRQCVICGKEFEPLYGGQRCCDKSYGNTQGRKTEKERGYELEQVTCARCGKPFSSPQYTGAVEVKMCSRCRHEWNRERNRRHRVAIAAAIEEVIDHIIFERDNWVCQLCGRPVDPECKWPNPMSQSIDHIIPLSRGGEHSMANVQLAHLGCNSRKNNNMEWIHEGPFALAYSGLFDLLLGGPGETRSSVADTIAFMKQIGPDCVGAALGVRLCPGTAMVERLTADGTFETGDGLRRRYDGPLDFVQPTFYISPALGEQPAALVRELIAGDERFFEPVDEAADGAGGHNYNDNTPLVQAIAAGARGAYWDILRQMRGHATPQ